jgi:CheY-like chemotaxis protein
MRENLAIVGVRFVLGESAVAFKVLIVEDNPDSRNLLHFLFTTKGIPALTAADGKEGLYLAKTETPDLIISGLNMADMGGAELVKLIHSDEEITSVPILIYTTYSALDAQPAVDAGALKVFFKPIDLDSLIDWVMDFAERASDQ